MSANEPIPNINVNIVDQRVNGLLRELPEIFQGIGDENRKRCLAFVLLCVSTALDISPDEAADYLTDGGQDEGVDALHMGEVEDGEFTVTIFQAKYKTSNMTGEWEFPENAVQKAIATVAGLFDPQKDLVLNNKLRPPVEEIRSLIRDGYIPTVRVILCNNGKKWPQNAQLRIDQTGFPPDQVIWKHFNHDNIVKMMQRDRKVDATLQLTGKALIEEFNYRRVLIGKVPVSMIAELFRQHGDLLLQRNVRRYLGLHANRVNTAIHQTLTDLEKRDNFYFFNNGITMICSKFRHNALQGENYSLQLEGMQIINGGQTCKTIEQTLNNPDLFAEYGNVYVLLRLYELADEDKDFILDITHATNSQNPVDLRDLKSNEPIQLALQNGLSDLGYTYRRQRGEESSTSKDISPNILAEAILAIWRQMPHQAKFRRKEHFGKLYSTIFTNDLQPAQALLAVLIFRRVENERKRPDMAKPPKFLPYASHYIAMLIGLLLLKANNVNLQQVSHKNYHSLETYFESNFEGMYSESVRAIAKALDNLYREDDLSLQQLSATFRRGDLLDYLDHQ